MEAVSEHANPTSEHYGVHAERMAIGTAIAYPDDVARLSDCLSPEDFTIHEHRLVWKALLELPTEVLRNAPALVEAIRPLFQRVQNVALIVGEWLDVSVVPTIIELQTSKDIKRFTRQRRLILNLMAFSRVAESPYFDVLSPEFEEEIGGLVALAKDRMTGRIISSKEAAGEFEIPTKEGIAANRVPTGLEELDKVNIFAPGRLTILAGRPGMGKSTLAREIVYNATAHGARTLVASLEAGYQELQAYLICADAAMDLSRFADGFANDEETQKLLISQANIAQRPIDYIKVWELSADALRLDLKKLCASPNPPRAVVIDYLGLMSHARTDTRQEAIAATTRSLKLTAEELGVSVVCLCQMNRQVEGREEGRPRLSDLRESGAIEQDADAVLFIWQQANAGVTPMTPQITRTVTVLKNRRGPTMEFDVLFDRPMGRIRQLTKYPPPEEDKWNRSV